VRYAREDGKKNNSLCFPRALVTTAAKRSRLIVLLFLAPDGSVINNHTHHHMPLFILVSIRDRCMLPVPLPVPLPMCGRYGELD